MSEQSGQATTDTATTTTAATEAASTTQATPGATQATDSTQAATTQAEQSSEATTATTESTQTEQAEKPPGAPEKYDFQKIDGLELGDEVMGKYGEIAKDLNLTQENAQRVLSEVGPLIAKQQAERFNALAEGWERDAKADKEIGGEKFAENLALARKGIDAYFSPDFVKLLDSSRLGNHPEMIRGFMKVGQLVSNDRFVAGGSGNKSDASPADKLYGKS